MTINGGNPFAVSLAYLIKLKGRGTQSAVGRKIKKSPSLINELSKGIKAGSEQTRRGVAAYFGYEYEDFLKLGEKLIKGGVKSSADLSISAISKKIQKHDKKPDIKDLLAKTREVLESGTPWADNMRMNIISTHTIFKSEQATEKKSG